jgi:NAD kinase
VWHVVSDEFVTGGRDGHSIVHTRWEGGPEMWRASRFVVLHPPGDAPDAADLPHQHHLLPSEGHVPTADIRFRIFHAGADGVDGLVAPGVSSYIRRHGLFASTLPPKETRIRLDRPRLMIVTGPQPEAKAVADRFRRYEGPDPDFVLVIGGDGTMLHAIRRHWRLRLPFVGLNAGHLGFLLNERLPDDLDGAELVLYRMPMLRVDVESPDGRQRQRMLAFGDAWVERDGGQAAWLKVDVDDVTQLEKVVGDGLLVATPAGSSAYARAMGATPIPLNSPVLTLAGSNVFQPRFWKPLALTDSSVVRMTNVDPTPVDRPKRPVRGYLDGEDLGRVRWMEIRVSPVAAVELSFTPEFDLTSRRLRSLFPPPEEKTGRG